MVGGNWGLCLAGKSEGGRCRGEEKRLVEEDGFSRSILLPARITGTCIIHMGLKGINTDV